MSIFKACDIRGVVGAEWGDADALKVGQALGQLMYRGGETTICVGGDFRRSTPSLKQALIRGLVQSGIDILDVGLQPTPVVHFAAKHLGCPNMATVTASHNPGRYNGIKFQLAGVPPDPGLIRRLEKGTDEPLPLVSPGGVTSYDVLADYEQCVLRQARLLACRARTTGASPAPSPTKKQNHGASDHAENGTMSSIGQEESHPHIVVDGMGGAFTHIAPRTLAAAGYAVTSICKELDHDFSGRSPNPSTDGNLASLIDAVAAQGADAGIAFDGDGDRAVLVDHTGRIVRPEQLAVLFLQECFDQPTVVYDLKCASILPRAVEAVGGSAIVRPSGYAFIKTEMIQRRAEMGVEASGHHFFGTLDGGDDGLFTALVAMRIVQQTGTSLAGLIEPIGWPAITPDLRISFAGDASATVETIADNCGGRVSRLDGVRAQYDDGWALARASVTEPAITFRFEGRSRDDLPRIVSRFLAAAPKILKLVREKMDE